MNPDKAFCGSVGAGLIAAAIGLAIALLLSGCITPGIRIQTSYGTIGYSKDTNTVTYELPSDPGFRK